MKKPLFTVLLCIAPLSLRAEIDYRQIDEAAEAVQPQVVEWRRWFHQNPELSNREFKTGQRIAEILTDMGLEPRTGIARTGQVRREPPPHQGVICHLVQDTVRPVLPGACGGRPAKNQSKQSINSVHRQCPEKK